MSHMLQVERRPEGEGFATHVIVSGQEPLLVNLTPTSVQRVTRILTLFSLTPTSQGILHAEAVKYRVVNLCDYALELCVKSEDRTIMTHVRPSGSLWEPLDDLILPHFASTLYVRVPGGRDSDSLLLEHPGVVTIPGSGAVAELLTPNPSHHLLLLATPLRVHNQTNLTLSIRFHDAMQREVLMVDIPHTAACVAILLGVATPAADSCVKDLGPGVPENSLVLSPNSLCAVPDVALIRSRSVLRTVLSLRPEGFGFCKATEVGADLAPRTVSCHTDQNLHIICESVSSRKLSTTLTTVVLRPSLVLLNALPGHITVGYAQKSGQQVHRSEAKLPSFSRFNVYDFPGALQEGLRLRVRLEGAAWSSPILVDEAAFGDPDVCHVLEVPDVQSCSLLVEPMTKFMLRVSCPHWFVDRSGLSRPLVLEACRAKEKLPMCDGICLLPVDCLEHPCNLLLRSACSIFSVFSITMPASWHVFSWQTPCGSFEFCLQTEDVESTDFLGAHCQVSPIQCLNGRALLLLAVRAAIFVGTSPGPEPLCLWARALMFCGHEPFCLWARALLFVGPSPYVYGHEPLCWWARALMFVGTSPLVCGHEPFCLWARALMFMLASMDLFAPQVFLMICGSRKQMSGSMSCVG